MQAVDLGLHLGQPVPSQRLAVLARADPPTPVHAVRTVARERPPRSHRDPRVVDRLDTLDLADDPTVDGTDIEHLHRLLFGPLGPARLGLAQQ